MCLFNVSLFIQKKKRKLKLKYLNKIMATKIPASDYDCVNKESGFQITQRITQDKMQRSVLLSLK